MKLMKRIAVGVASLLLISSCSILQSVTSAASTGSNTGSAISAIYNVLKAAGGIDLSNLTNIINIGKILTGAGALSNATQSYTDEFATALINSSNNLVNSSNVSKVISGLKALNNIDTSAFSESATKAYANGTQQIQQNDKNVNATVDAITSLLGAL
jgi:hypothetical protein